MLGRSLSGIRSALCNVYSARNNRNAVSARCNCYIVKGIHLSNAAVRERASLPSVAKGSSQSDLLSGCSEGATSQSLLFFSVRAAAKSCAHVIAGVATGTSKPILSRYVRQLAQTVSGSSFLPEAVKPRSFVSGKVSP